MGSIVDARFAVPHEHAGLTAGHAYTPHLRAIRHETVNRRRIWSNGVLDQRALRGFQTSIYVQRVA